MDESFTIKWKETVPFNVEFFLTDRPLKTLSFKSKQLNVKLSIRLEEKENKSVKQYTVTSLLLHIKGEEQQLLKLLFGSICLNIRDSVIDYTIENVAVKLDSTNGFYTIRNILNQGWEHEILKVDNTSSFGASKSTPSTTFAPPLNTFVFSTSQNEFGFPQTTNVKKIVINFTCILIIQEEVNNISIPISSLFSCKRLSDVKIICPDKDFEVHKAVLGAWSPVFLKMFESDFQEASNGEVNIKDAEPEAMEIFLKFMYSGQISNLIGHEKEILYLADKYCVEQLKEHCFHLLSLDLTPPKFITYFDLACLYRGDINRSNITKYFDCNNITIMDLDDWRTVMEQHPKECAIFLELSTRRAQGDEADVANKKSITFK